MKLTDLINELNRINSEASGEYEVEIMDTHFRKSFPIGFIADCDKELKIVLG
ncbi:hypothetical protein [Bacillus sp. ISL-57]|uniref:hypothetical protein n=1 Tax=Bacillus sp. ISL-57 TaxID=2819135 RepID=UPI001BE776E3|nr:hypothetical protein [Bacillus sp. ISL-57]MBT2718067.1 hypothetical protein [Bacillus sp. ISL-57]